MLKNIKMDVKQRKMVRPCYRRDLDFLKIVATIIGKVWPTHQSGKDAHDMI